MSVNIVIMNCSLPLSEQPAIGIACTTCPLGHWMETRSDIKCFCTKINKITWDRYRSDKIWNCSSQIDAIAKEDAKKHREMATPLMKKQIIAELKDRIVNERI